MLAHSLDCNSYGKIALSANTGSKWHSSLPYDPKSCTQGDLPRFLYRFYEECQPPPRLSLLDKYALNTHFTPFPSFGKIGLSNLLLLQHTWLQQIYVSYTSTLGKKLYGGEGGQWQQLDSCHTVYPLMRL